MAPIDAIEPGLIWGVGMILLAVGTVIAVLLVPRPRRRHSNRRRHRLGQRLERSGQLRRML